MGKNKISVWKSKWMVALYIFVIIGLALFFSGIFTFGTHVKPTVVFDNALQVPPRQVPVVVFTSGNGTYRFEVNSTAGISIRIFKSMDDYNVFMDNGQGAEAYACSADNALKFNQECAVSDGAVLGIINPSSSITDNVAVRITKIS